MVGIHLNTPTSFTAATDLTEERPDLPSGVTAHKAGYLASIIYVSGDKVVDDKQILIHSEYKETFSNVLSAERWLKWVDVKRKLLESLSKDALTENALLLGTWGTCLRAGRRS